MDGLIRQALRLWATIIVVWALVLSGLAPSLAAGAGGSGTLETVICSADGQHASSPDGAPIDHGKLCCIACSVATAAVALPSPDGEPVPAIAPVAVTRIGLLSDRAPAPRASPGSWPLSPRAPPVLG